MSSLDEIKSYLHAGKYREAISLATVEIGSLMRSGDSKNLSKLNLIISEGHLRLANYQDARKLALDAMTTAIRNNQPDDLGKAYLILAEIEFRSGDQSKADAYIKKAKSLTGENPTFVPASPSSYEQIVKELPPEVFAKILDIIKQISIEPNFDKLLGEILDGILGLSKGEFSFIVLEKEGRLICELARHRTKRDVVEQELMPSRTAAQIVTRTGAPLLSTKAAADPMLMGAESVERMNIYSIICVPLKVGGKIIGAIYVDTRTQGRTFTEKDRAVVQILADQAAIVVANAILMARTIRDPTTRLFNHGYMEQRLEEEVSRSKRYKRPCTFLLIDVDHFKTINDTHGHDVGTNLLKQISSFIGTMLRSTDITARTDTSKDQKLIGRYGGDEFEVLLPETSKQSGLIASNRLLSSIRKQVFMVGNRSISLTLSIGLATFPDDAQDAKLLFLKADEALYKAKESGRNQIRYFQV